MNALEFVIWGSLTLILLKYNEKPIYEYLLDLKYWLLGEEYNIEKYEILEE